MHDEWFIHNLEKEHKYYKQKKNIIMEKIQTKTIIALIFSAIFSLASHVNADEKVTYYHHDALGSVILATDENGITKWSESYAPYGQQQVNDSAKSDKIGFTGHQHDKSENLIYMGARYYDPNTSRFLGIDPVNVKLGNSSTFNRYSYAANNPYKYTDPNGEHFIIAALLFVGFTAAGFVMDDLAMQSCIASPNSCNGQALPSSVSLPGEGIITGGGVKITKLLAGSIKQASSKGIYKSLDDIFSQGVTPKASQLKEFAESKGWKASQTENGPLKYIDENGIPRITIKKGSSRTPGSENPHVELKDSTGQRINPAGNPVPRKSPENHTPIDYDL